MEIFEKNPTFQKNKKKKTPPKAKVSFSKPKPDTKPTKEKKAKPQEKKPKKLKTAQNYDVTKDETKILKKFFLWFELK